MSFEYLENVVADILRFHNLVPAILVLIQSDHCHVRHSHSLVTAVHSLVAAKSYILIVWSLLYMVWLLTFSHSDHCHNMKFS